MSFFGRTCSSYSSECGWLRHTRRRRFTGFTLVAAFTLLLSLIPIFVVGDGVHENDLLCYEHFVKADTNRDNEINESEYLNAVNALSDGHFQELTLFDELPPVIRETFYDLTCQFIQSEGDDSCCKNGNGQINIIGMTGGESTSDEEAQHVRNICSETRGTITAATLDASFIAPRMAPAQEQLPAPTLMNFEEQLQVVRGRNLQASTGCRTVLVLSDGIAGGNADSAIDRLEYITVVNLLSGGAWLDVTLFSNLPQVLQDNFIALAGPGVTDTINIFGARATEDADETQELFLEQVCDDTNTAVDQALVGVPTPAPVSEPTINMFGCFARMALSDRITADGLIDREEYVIFVNLFVDGSDPWDDFAFEELPVILQLNFVSLAGPGVDATIDTFGSRPGQNPSPEQEEYLEQVCVQTDEAVDIALGPTPPPATLPPNPPPTLAPSLAPTGDMTQEPSTAPSASPSGTAPTISPSISPTMVDSTLAPSTSPTMGGGPTGTPSLAPTESAAPSVVEPTLVPSEPTSQEPSIVPSSSPSSSPSVEPEDTIPSAAPSPALSQSAAPSRPPTATVFTPFVISNTEGLTAAGVEALPIRDELEEAYNVTAAQVVDSTTFSRRSRQLRGSVEKTRIELRMERRLQVDLVSGELGPIRDGQCPDGTPNGTLCQDLLMANFVVDISDEETESSIIVSQLQSAMLAAIDDGTLQANLDSVNANNPIDVVEGVRPDPTMPPAMEPTEPPSEDSGDDGLSTGIIIGLVFLGLGGATLFGVGGHQLYKRYNGRPPLKSESSYRLNNGAGAPTYDDIVESQRFPKDDDMSGDGDILSAFKKSGRSLDDSNQEYDSVGWSKPEEEAYRGAAYADVHSGTSSEVDSSSGSSEGSSRQSYSSYESGSSEEKSGSSDYESGSSEESVSSEYESSSQESAEGEDRAVAAGEHTSSSGEEYESDEDSEVSPDAAYVQDDESDMHEYEFDEEPSTEAVDEEEGRVASVPEDYDSSSNAGSSGWSSGEMTSDDLDSREEGAPVAAAATASALDDAEGSEEGDSRGMSMSPTPEEQESGAVPEEDLDAPHLTEADKATAVVAPVPVPITPTSESEQESEPDSESEPESEEESYTTGSEGMDEESEPPSDHEEVGGHQEGDGDSSYEQFESEGEDEQSSFHGMEEEDSFAQERAMATEDTGPDRQRGWEPEYEAARPAARSGGGGGGGGGGDDGGLSGGAIAGIAVGGAAAVGAAAVGVAALRKKGSSESESGSEKEDESMASSHSEEHEADLVTEDYDSAHSGEREADLVTEDYDSAHSEEHEADLVTEDYDSGESSVVESTPASSAHDRDLVTEDYDSGESSVEEESASALSDNPAEVKKRAEYRAEVEALVRIVVPDEIENVDVVMSQFRGREAELVATLRTMQERTITQRARAAVHKSRHKPESRLSRGPLATRGASPFSSISESGSMHSRGSTAGSAIVAAASVPRPSARRPSVNDPSAESFFSESAFTNDSYSYPEGSTETRSAFRSVSSGSEGVLGRLNVSDSESDSESESESSGGDYIPQSMRQGSVSEGESETASGSDYVPDRLKGQGGSESTSSNMSDYLHRQQYASESSTSTSGFNSEMDSQEVTPDSSQPSENSTLTSEDHEGGRGFLAKESESSGSALGFDDLPSRWSSAR